mgnify:CR=1 FL=1
MFAFPGRPFRNGERGARLSERLFRNGKRFWRAFVNEPRGIKMYIRVHTHTHTHRNAPGWPTCRHLDDFLKDNTEFSIFFHEHIIFMTHTHTHTHTEMHWDGCNVMWMILTSLRDSRRGILRLRGLFRYMSRGKYTVDSNTIAPLLLIFRVITVLVSRSWQLSAVKNSGLFRMATHRWHREGRIGACFFLLHFPGGPFRNRVGGQNLQDGRFGTAHASGRFL